MQTGACALSPASKQMSSGPMGSLRNKSCASYGLSTKRMDIAIEARPPCNRALQALGGGWAVLAGLYRLPPIRLLEDLGYRWFADHRAWFARWGTRPACEDSGADCTGDV